MKTEIIQVGNNTQIQNWKSMTPQELMKSGSLISHVIARSGIKAVQLVTRIQIKEFTDCVPVAWSTDSIKAIADNIIEEFRSYTLESIFSVINQIQFGKIQRQELGRMGTPEFMNLIRNGLSELTADLEKDFINQHKKLNQDDKAGNLEVNKEGLQRLKGIFQDIVDKSEERKSAESAESAKRKRPEEDPQMVHVREQYEREQLNKKRLQWELHQLNQLKHMLECEVCGSAVRFHILQGDTKDHPENKEKINVLLGTYGCKMCKHSSKVIQLENRPQ